MGYFETRTDGTTDTWLTPQGLISALGPFDLDPCAAPEPRPWPTADRMISLPQDGLVETWAGCVWLNPPFRGARHWVHRLAEHGDGIALVAARTETRMWHASIFPQATGMCFLNRRLTFHGADGVAAPSPGRFPPVLVAYGRPAWTKMLRAGLSGAYVTLKENA